jgi:O-antigen ligase
VGIIGIFLAILLLLINFGFFRYAIVFVPLSILLFNYSYENVDEFRDRYDGTTEIFTTGNYQSYQINGSSFVLYNNYHVALENFKRNPILGTGLGSHPTAFDKYSLTNLEGAVDIDFNKMDANSMALRLMSETGLYGLFLMFFLLVRCWVPKQRTHDTELWVMSNATMIIIVLYLVRQGHYFLNGFPFFLWMYYYIAKENWKYRDEKREEEEKERIAAFAIAINQKNQAQIQ